MWNKSKIDIDQLVLEIRRLKPTQKLYKTLRDELTKLGYWKQKARWKPEGFTKKRAKNI